MAENNILELNKIKNMDFKEYLKSIPDNSVDFTIADPPFSTLKGAKLEEGFNPDTDIDYFFKEIYRVMKNNTFIAFFGMQKIITKGIYKNCPSLSLWNLKAAENGFKFKQEIIWDKKNGNSFVGNLSNIHENISIFTKGAAVFNPVKVSVIKNSIDNNSSLSRKLGFIKQVLSNKTKLEEWRRYYFEKENTQNLKNVDYVNPNSEKVSFAATGRFKAHLYVCRTFIEGVRLKSIIREEEAKSIIEGLSETKKNRQINKTSLAHPTQKSIKVLQTIIKLCSNKEDIVLDPFMGSGTTAIACIDENRKYIGCEISNTYYVDAEKRIEEYKGVFNDIK